MRVAAVMLGVVLAVADAGGVEAEAVDVGG